MIRGGFNPRSGASLLFARLRVASQGIDEEIYFVIDTGAARSTLAPNDARRLGVDFDSLPAGAAMLGAGGRIAPRRVAAVVVIEDPGDRAYEFDVNLVVLEPADYNRQFLSLLGRDVLNRLRMVYDPLGEGLTFEVRRADRTIQVS